MTKEEQGWGEGRKGEREMGSVRGILHSSFEMRHLALWLGRGGGYDGFIICKAVHEAAFNKEEMMTKIRLLVVMIGLAALAGCGRAAEPLPTVAPTADVSGLTTEMQSMMTAMQGLMGQMPATPSPEMMGQMQGLMTGMMGMIGQMQGMPGANTAEMQAMMAQMQALMAQIPVAGTPMPMPGMGMPGMQGMMGDAPIIPAGRAYAEGQEVRFIHTEASDAATAQLLTDMMASPVLVVPALAEAPESALATVYVFTNGVPGMGPLGFQPDVFDNPPDSAGYSPLRRVHLLTWGDPAAAVELTSAADVAAALADGRLTEEVPGVVVNMPFITWADGQR